MKGDNLREWRYSQLRAKGWGIHEDGKGGCGKREEIRERTRRHRHLRAIGLRLAAGARRVSGIRRRARRDGGSGRLEGRSGPLIYAVEPEEVEEAGCGWGNAGGGG